MTRLIYCNGFDQRIARQQFYTRTQQQNGVIKSCSRQQLGKHISAYPTVLCNAVTSSTIGTVLSVGSVQSDYKRREFRSKCSSEQLRVQEREWSMSLVNCED
jgi:hypothetical protein